MAEEKLELVQLAAGGATESSAAPPKIARCKFAHFVPSFASASAPVLQKSLELVDVFRQRFALFEMKEKI